MKHKKLSPEDYERRSRLIYSYYRVGGALMKKDELARAAGYSNEYISRLFSGERRISDEAAHNLAKVLNVRENYLLCKDEYMTDEEFQKVMEKADGLASAINLAATNTNFYYAGIGLDECTNTSGLSEELASFISNAHTFNRRYIMNVKDKMYVSVDDNMYKNFCDDISDYIQFKLQKLYKDNPKYSINEVRERQP